MDETSQNAGRDAKPVAGQAKTYKIGQAASLLGLKTHVLRFWETEFPQIAPVRTGTGQRQYTEDQIVLIRRIQHLLYDEGLTIDGAKKRLGETADNHSLLGQIRAELAEIRAMLHAAGPSGPHGD